MTDDTTADTMMAENTDVPANDAVGEQPTVELTIPIDDVHDGIVTTLTEAGVDVEKQLAAQLQPSVESLVHDMYQQGKYQSQQQQ